MITVPPILRVLPPLLPIFGTPAAVELSPLRCCTAENKEQNSASGAAIHSVNMMLFTCVRLMAEQNLGADSGASAITFYNAYQCCF